MRTTVAICTGWGQRRNRQESTEETDQGFEWSERIAPLWFLLE